MHDSRFIANRFIESAMQSGQTLTPMQLLKLVYIAHGWMLGLYGTPLTSDPIEAWKFGPVIPRLYRAVRHCKDGPVLELLPSNQESLVPAETDMIRQVFEEYGDDSGIALSNLTHRKGTPWHTVYEDGVTHIPIPNDLIEAHYKELAEAVD